MVLFNYAIREITAKLVYYGPGLCGKTTNLQFIHEKLDPGSRGKLLSLATDGDRTLFFDFLPIEMGAIGGYKVRFQLYTVPGQVHYNATRKLVLKGVDAVAFVADSQLSMVERNRESFENLIENLIENGYDPAKIPIVIQCNKRDLQNISSVGELVASMGVEGYPVVEAVASRGDGVFETLKAIVKLTLSRLRTQFDTGVAGAAERPAAIPPPPAAVFSPPAPAASAFEPPPPAPAPAAVRAPLPAAAVFPPPSPAAPAAAAAGSPAAENLDEFDLTDFADEVAPPAPSRLAETAFTAEESRADGGWDPESVFADLPEAEVPAPAGGEADATGEVDWAAAQAEEAYAYAPEAETSGLPHWAVELQEEVRRLSEENLELRQALSGLAALLGGQIDVLREGREELERRLGREPGETAP